MSPAGKRRRKNVEYKKMFVWFQTKINRTSSAAGPRDKIKDDRIEDP
jgi:hypothetical protein